MGKTIFADQCLLDILTSLTVKENEYVFGLIIGQPTVKKDYVVHLTVTPNVSNETSAGIQDIQKIEGSMKLHLRNVIKTLPGGIYVFGIFIVSPTDILSDKVGLQKVRSLISSLHSCTKSNVYLFGDNENLNKIVLHFNSKSNKYQCKSFEVQNMNMAMSTVNWKFAQNSTRWYTVDCHYSMKTLLPYFNNKSLALTKLSKDLLAIYKSTIEKSICIINGYYIGNYRCDTLTEIREKLKLEGNVEDKDINKEEFDYLNNFEAMVFIEEPFSEDVEQIDELNQQTYLQFYGTLCSKVFLHNLATIEEAVKAVKEDLIRSFTTRLELHCDSLESGNSSGERTIIHTLPRRVLVKHPSLDIMFSDYMFPDDVTEDIVISIKEQLGIDIKPESITHLEQSGILQKTETLENKKEISNPSTSNIKVKRSKNLNILILGLIGASFVLIISILAHYLL